MSQLGGRRETIEGEGRMSTEPENDVIHEMWLALAEVSPAAHAYGFGPEWHLMIEQRDRENVEQAGLTAGALSSKGQFAEYVVGGDIDFDNEDARDTAYAVVEAALETIYAVERALETDPADRREVGVHAAAAVTAAGKVIATAKAGARHLGSEPEPNSHVCREAADDAPHHQA